jgi:hypothetical protein
MLDAQSVPLRVAARTGRTDICKLLLDNKADPNDFEKGSGIPIMVAAVEHDSVVKLLIEYKTNLKRRITCTCMRTGLWFIGDEATALHYAVMGKNPQSVRLLIDAGLDPNAADEDGQTPLLLAVKLAIIHQRLELSKSAKIIECLLENNASLRFSNRTGATPLSLANAKECPEEIRQLLVKKDKENDRQNR